jgi:hypothetical protein
MPKELGTPENFGRDTLNVGGFLADENGNIFQIKEIINATTNEIRVYDIHEHSPTVRPKENRIGYIYEWQTDAPISPIYLYKLTQSARDNVNIAEKFTAWNHRGLQIDDGSTDENNVTKLTLSTGLVWAAGVADSGWVGGLEGTLSFEITGGVTDNFVSIDSSDNLQDSGVKDTDLVHIAGTETITGAKTFSAATQFDANVTIGDSSPTTLTLQINNTIAIQGILDEDDFSSDSAIHVPTQQSTKAYVLANVNQGSFLDSVIYQQTDATTPDPGGAPTLGDRYIVLDTANIHSNFKGSYGSVAAWLAGEGVVDNDIVEWDGADFIQVFDSVAATAGVTVTVGTDKNANSDHDWYYNTTDDEWYDRGSATLHNILSDLQGGVANEYYHLTSAEHTLVDGITATFTEINTLDGVNATLTASELNYLDGSNVSNNRIVYSDGTKFTSVSTFVYDGSLGVGISSPSGLLHTKTTANNWIISENTDHGFIEMVALDTATSNTAIFFDNAGDFSFRSQPKANLGTASGETTRLIIEGDTGYVGIGTSPSTALEVSGVITISGGGGTSTNWKTAYDNSINANPVFDTGTGVITFTQLDATTLTVDIDGRYEPSLTFGILNGNALKVTESVTATDGEIARFTSTGIESISNFTVAAQLQSVFDHNSLDNLDSGSSYLHLNSTEKGRVQNPADGATDGYLIMSDWTTFNNKEPAIAGGTSSQYWRGDKTWQTFLGETSSTAYRGDRGKIAYDHSQITTGNPHSLDLADIGESYADINYWVLSGSNLYYNSGEVYIGDTSGDTTLHVKGSNGPPSGTYATNAANSNTILGRTGSGTGLIFGINSFTYAWMQVQNSSDVMYDLMLQPAGGNVVIGGTSASYTLDVTGTIGASGGNSTNWNTAYTHVSSNGSDHSFIDQSVVAGSSPSFVNTNMSGNISVWTNNSGYITGNETITLSGDVSGSGTTAITTTIGSSAVEGSMLNNNVISSQTALTSGLVSTDEFLISDAGVLKRMDVSVLTDYLDSNFSYRVTATHNYHTFTAFNGTATGDYNVAMGHLSLVSVTTGGYNVAMGPSSGDGLTGGNRNVIIGYNTCSRSGFASDDNVVIGANAYLVGIGGSVVIIGADVGGGTLNASTGDILLGYQAVAGGPANTNSYNTFMGYQVAYNGGLAQASSVAIGHQSMYGSIVGGAARTGNIAIGYRSLYYTGSASSYIIAMGYEAGYNSTLTAGISKSVFIGYQAGYSETGSNMLYIAGSSSANPLIKGDFVNEWIEINGMLILDERNTTSYAASATITPNRSYERVQGTGAVTLNATTAISNGSYTGQILVLQGKSNTNTLTVPDNANTKLAGNCTLGDDDTLTLLWEGSDWIEISRSNN